MAALTPNPKFQGFDASGDPLAGGLLYAYATGTSTPLDTYTTQVGNVANANPVVLDARGEANVWLGNTSLYRFTLKTAAGVTIWGPIDGVGDTLAGTGGSALVGFLQSGSGAVAQTMYDVLNQVVWASSFGFVPAASAATNTAALALIAAKMNALGGGTLFIAPGTYQINGSAASATLCQFTSLKGLTVLAAGVTIADQTVYADGTYGLLFGHNASNNVTYRGLKITSQAYVSGDSATGRGIKAFQFGQGSTGIDLQWEQVGGTTGVEFYRAYTDSDAMRCRNITINLNATTVHYPINGQHSGENIRGILRAVNCGRNVYIYGTKDVKLQVYSKNQKVTSLLAAFNGYGCDDIEIDYYDRDSDSCTAAAPVMTIQYTDTTAAAMRDIRLNFNISNPSGSPFSSTLTFAKYNGSGSADTTGRGHLLDGIHVSGVSQQYTGRNHIGTTAGAFVTTGTPDVLRNVHFEDFTGRTATIDDDWSGVVGALSGRMEVENVNYDTNLNVGNTTNGRVVFFGCTAANFSTNTTDTDLQDLISCNVTSGTLQAISGKRFINSPFSRSGINFPAYGEWITPSFSALNFSANGTMTWTVAAGDVTTYQYTIIGKMMTVNFHIVTSTIGGAVNTSLQIAIPSGRVAATSAQNPLAYIVDNGVAIVTGMARVAAAGTVIFLEKTAPAANWTASADNAEVRGQITFEIQ